MTGKGVMILNRTGNILTTYKEDFYFPLRMVKHWHKLPRGVLEAPFLVTFKVRLDSPGL